MSHWVPMCLCLDFNGTPLCINIWLTMYDNSDLHKIQLAPNLPEGICYLSRGVSLLFPYITVVYR